VVHSTVHCSDGQFITFLTADAVQYMFHDC